MAIVESFSGIRGIYGTELTKEVITKYGNSFFQFLLTKNKNPKIVIGMDTRPSGDEVFKLLIKGIDCEIIDLGILPTPAIENAVRAFDCSGGIIITASHNEPQYNGFKFLDKDGAVLRPNDANFIIEKSHELNNINLKPNNRKINFKRDEAILEYKKLLKDIIKTDNLYSEFKILIDPNGGSGMISREIFNEYKVNAEYFNMETGKFNRLVEPNESSLKYLVDILNKNNCDFAIGFDCDADRAEILLKNGELVSGNQILALIAEEILSNNESLEKTIVVNDATSYLVKEMAEMNNCRWIEVEVGEINVVDGMIKNNSPVGGEGSNGGVIIPPCRCRDGILCSLLLLKLIINKNKPLKEIIDELPKYYYIKEKVKLKEDFLVLKSKVKKYYTESGFLVLETGDATGGLKAIKDNSWVWFRQSKTEDKMLRIIADSKNKEIAKKLIEEAKNLL